MLEIAENRKYFEVVACYLATRWGSRETRPFAVSFSRVYRSPILQYIGNEYLERFEPILNIHSERVQKPSSGGPYSLALSNILHPASNPIPHFAAASANTGLAQVIKHEIAGPALSLSLTPIHSLRHRLVRSRQYGEGSVAGFLRY